MTDPKEKKPMNEVNSTEWEFKSSDFWLVSENGHRYEPDWSNDATAFANHMLREERAKALVVYNCFDGDKFTRTNWTEIKWFEDTHRARLEGIEEL